MRSSAEQGGRRVFVPIALAAFITSLDTTVVTTAAPSIRADLHLTLSGLEWVATSYVLAFASMLLVGGRLTDLIGRRKVLLAGMTIFGLASLLVALAPGIGLMLAGRTLQGAGAALVMPAALAVLASDVSGRDRHLGAGIYTIAIAGSLALGPFVGGAISQYLHWTYIFWINVPVVLIAWAAVLWAIPPSPAVTSVQAHGLRAFVGRLDLGGLTFSSVALGALTFALIEGQKLGATDPLVLTALAVAVLAVPVAVWIGQRSQFPLLQLDLLKHRVVLGGSGVQILWGLGINGVFFFTSIFLQEVMGFSPSTSGLAFVPLAGSLILAVPFAAKLASRWGAHRVVFAGMVVVAAGLVSITFAGPGDSMFALMPGLVLIGIGSALTTPLTSAVLEMVPPSRAGMVSAAVSVSREVSGVLGIAVTGAVLTFREQAALRSGAPPHDAFLSGYRLGLYAGAVLALAGGAIALATLRPGQEMLADHEALALADADFDDTHPEHAELRAQLGDRQDAELDNELDTELGTALLDSEQALSHGMAAGMADLVIDVRDEVLYPGRELDDDELAWPDEVAPGNRGR